MDPPHMHTMLFVCKKLKGSAFIHCDSPFICLCFGALCNRVSCLSDHVNKEYAYGGVFCRHIHCLDVAGVEQDRDPKCNQTRLSFFFFFKTAMSQECRLHFQSGGPKVSGHVKFWYREYFAINKYCAQIFMSYFYAGD